MGFESKKTIAPGKWYTKFDENGNCIEAYYDESYRKLLGFASEAEYANAQKSWTDKIHPDDQERLNAALADGLAKHPEGKDFDIEYRMMTKWGYHWFHDYGHCTRREDGSLIRCDGVVFDIQDIKDFEHEIAHRNLRKEVLDYIVNHEEENPIDLLKQFGEKLRVLFNCDQFICRDLEETRIMVNSPEIEKTWSVPIDYCRQCQHFDAHHPMYKDGYTEMENCQEGWQGIPVFEKCPIKSSLTRIVYCNGRVAGYAALHYLNSYHKFTDIDRETFAEFINCLSLVLSKYEAKQELLKEQKQKESKAQKIAENYARILSLEDNFISVYDLDLESGKYEMFVKDHAEDEGVNDMMVNNGDFFEDTLKNVLLVIHPDDREDIIKVLSRNYVRERLGKEGHFDYCYRLLVNGVTIWAKMRIAYKDAEKRRVLIGTFNADEEMVAKNAEEERHKAILQNNTRIMALEDNLESIYEVELESGKYIEYVKGDFYQQNVANKLLPKGDYFADLRGNIDAVIYPEDRDALFNVLDRKSIQKSLARTDRIEHYYRMFVGKEPIWFKIRIVYKDTDKKAVIIGCFHADEEVKERQNEEQRRQILLNQMAGDDGVFIVDCEHDTRKTIHDSRRGIDGPYEQSGYSDFITKHIMTHTAEPDRKMMLEVSSPEYMLNRLKTENEFSVRFRDIMTGRPQHFEMKIMKLSDTEVLQTFTNKDREIISNLISSSLEQDYFALYGVDLDFGQIQVVKDSPFFPQGGVGTTDDYSSSIKRFASNFSGDTKEFFEKISNLDNIKRLFASENKSTYTYQASTGQWVNVIGLVLSRHEDGTPSLFALGFNFTDSLESKVREAQKQISEDMHVIGGLANEYHALYYVNIKENFFKIYSIDEKKFPEAKHMVTEKVAPEDVFKRFGQSPLVHPDDKVLFTALRPETIQEKLAHNKKFTIRYRRKFGDKFLWSEMEFIKFEDIDTPANIIAVGFAEKDAEIRSEQILSRCYSILGKDITPHAAIDELLSLTGDYYDAKRAYIFEFSKDEDYVINTYEWCKEGIEPMIEHLQNIPAKEVTGWMREFKNQGAFFMDSLDEANTTEEGRAILEMQGIQSVIAAPIMDGDKIVGFIGVDDPNEAKKQVDLLKSVAIVAHSEILKRKENDEEHITLQKLTDTFLSVYFADLSRDYIHTWKIDDEYKDAYGYVTSYSESMGGYVRNFIAVRDRERCVKMTSPEYVLEQFKTTDRFSIEMTDIMLGYERDVVMDYVKVSGDGNQFVICAKDVTESLTKERQQHALSDGLAREYHTVWLVDGFGDHRLHLFRSTGKKTVQKAVQRGLDEPTYDGTMVKYVMDSVHEDDRERVLEASKFETVQRETPDVGTYVVSYKRYCDDKGTVDYHQMCFAKAVADDGTVNYILAFRDADKMLREQIEMQNQLQEALAMAQSASRAKTTFLNNMSHDIRTPMNAIIGYTGLAASHIDNKEQVQDFLGKIGQSSEHLLSLINDVLDMSRIESGKMNLNENPEKISDIIHTIRDIVQHDIHAKRLEFYVDAVDVNDEDVFCDKLRLNQILLNILSNAIKYTPAGGTISMRVKEKTVKENGYATYEFHFKDNGMGMDEEFLKTIFDPFTRMKSSTVSGIQGTGLGMAITKNIIDMMGGSIDIQSAPGKGTEVTILLDFKLQSEPKAPEVIPELHGLRGLVVDDDASACMSIANMLRDTGMRPEWCTSGKEAVLRAGEGYRIGDLFKVYIIDWLMPDMNGIETTRRIRKVIGDDAPIIILTAYDWSDIEEEAREAGVTAFVSKPMFPSDLHRLLSKCLGKGGSEAEPKEIQYELTGKKILLVEDNELNREIATAVLEEFGCIISTAEDGDIAVEMMKEAKPGDYDIVLMDVQMPTMDGYEATRQIRALDTAISKIPILAMTANAFEEDRKAALLAGMDDHIAKPIDIEKLKETLAKFL